jgi:hypothetical protein
MNEDTNKSAPTEQELPPLPEITASIRIAAYRMILCKREGSNYATMTQLARELYLRQEQLLSVISQRDKLEERLKYATHFFDSPASFSNEEFAAIAEKVYGGDTKYRGRCPHLDERCAAEQALSARLELEKKQ